jgi:hypothetical protein
MLHPTTLALTRLVAVVALLCCASPTRGQDLPQPWADSIDYPGRVDISASVGVGTATDWSDLVLLGSISPAFGVIEQVLVRDLRVRPDTQIGAAVTYWRGRYGFRAQASRSKSTLVIGSAPVDAFAPLPLRDAAASVDLDTWSYDVRGVVGLIDYKRGWWVWPYAWLGFGGITYDLRQSIAPPLLTFIEGGRSLTPEELVIVDQHSHEFLLSVDEVAQDSVFAFNLGVGTDVRLPLGPSGVGLRLELSDHVSQSPVGLRIGELRRSNVWAADTGLGSKFVHHLRATAGFVVYIRR